MLIDFDHTIEKLFSIHSTTRWEKSIKNMTKINQKNLTLN